MRSLAQSLAICAATVVATVFADAQTGARASWCAMYRVGGTNCGFSTHAQCLAAVSGVGGSCNQSPDSVSTTAAPERIRRERPERKKREAAPKRQEPVRASIPAAPAQTPAAGPAAATAPVQPASQQPLDFASARQLVLSGKYDAGIAALRALKFDDHPDIATFLGLAYRKLGRLDEARIWYESALAGDPNHRLALSFYGMMRAETGDLNSARADLEKLRLTCGGTECNEYQALAGVIAARRR